MKNTQNPYPLMSMGKNEQNEIFQSEETGYRLLVENANDAILITIDGYVVFHNRKTEILSGYSTDELNRLPFSSFIRSEDRNKITPQEQQGTLSFRILTKTGEELWCQSSFVSITWNGKTGILWFISDLTPQKALEDQLQQSQKMEALGTLVAGIAHEINNPVNLIMYNMPLLKKVWNDLLPVIKQDALTASDKRYGGLTGTFLEENLLQMLSDIDMAANRIAKIITDLKNFSKQTDISDKELMDMNQAVENALRLAQSTLKKSNITVTLDLAKHLPQILGNIHSIEQVILNMIINATQSMGQKQGKIKIQTGYQAGTGQVFIAIFDNGRGINPSISHKIFDPFVTDKQAEGGTGLGLSVSYNLVKAHNGEIKFKNLEEGGAVFTILLPTRQKGKSYKILIADDDELVRDILVEVLKKNETYLVEEAFNGIEACIKIGTYKPDLLILDILMPEMDGLEVCRTITRNDEFSDLNVMITTGYPDHPKVKEVKKLGFANIHAKPFDLKDFLSNVDKILTS